MPMDRNSPPMSPLRQCFEKLQSPTKELNTEWRQRAEEELNETPENYKQRTNALRLQVLSKYPDRKSPNGGDERGIVADDVNLNVPDEEEFLLRFLRARKFDSQKAFTMVRRRTNGFCFDESVFSCNDTTS